MDVAMLVEIGWDLTQGKQVLWADVFPSKCLRGLSLVSELETDSYTGNASCSRMSDMHAVVS